MRELLKKFGCASALVVCFVWVSLYAADASRIKSGSIVVGSPVGLAGGRFDDVAGTHAFSYAGGAEGGASEGDCMPCSGGQTISLSTNLEGTYVGTATFNGRQYELDGSNGQGAFVFDSPDFVLPASFSGDEFVVEQPFLLVDSSMSLPREGEAPLMVSLEGGGTARARYDVSQEDGQTLYFLTDITFTFDN